MPNIALVTDSTANFPRDIVEELNLHVIPLNIHWSGDTYLDGVDITTQEFYDRLEEAPELPTTSQPSMKAFLDKYNELADDGTYDGIMVVLISSGISGTMDSALSAAKEFDRLPLEIVDTKNTSGGLALVVLAAANELSAGLTLEDAAERTRAVSMVTNTYFAVDTLKYLHKGGRIGGASRLLGTLLNFKPILMLDDDGQVEALERVRTRKKALDRMVEIAVDSVSGKPAVVSVFHASDPDVAATFSDMVQSKVDCKELHVYDLSPVIGTHTGPGTFGLAIYPSN